MIAFALSMVCVGFGLGLLVGTYVCNSEHRAWCDLVDRALAQIDKRDARIRELENPYGESWKATENH